MVPKQDPSRASSIAQVLGVLAALISLVALVLDFSKGKTSQGLLDLATAVIALAIAGGIRFATKPRARS